MASIPQVGQQPLLVPTPLETEPNCLEKIKRFICDFFEWLCNLFSSKEVEGKKPEELKGRVEVEGQESTATPPQYDAETLAFYKTLAPLKTLGQTADPSAKAVSSTQRLTTGIIESDKTEDPESYKNQFYEQQVNRVKKIYTTYFSQRYADTPMMGHVNWIPGSFGLHMRGIALVVSHLGQKYGFKEFYACETLEGFAKKLDQFIKDPTVMRGAFVVPCFSSGPEQGFKSNFAQHKVSVLVDKSDGIKIVVLNAQKIVVLNAQKNGDVTPEKIQGKDDIWQGWETPGSFSSQEVVFRAILKANLPKESELFFGNTSREHQYGCESFAIQDALAFLRDPAFFTKIKLSGDPLQVNGMSLQTIFELPFAFLIGMQSLKELGNATAFASPQDLVVKTKEGQEKTLPGYLSKYSINNRNHYITVKSCRYNEIVLQMLKELSQEQIDQRLQATLVV
jgi:hypothetical protein